MIKLSVRIPRLYDPSILENDVFNPEILAISKLLNLCGSVVNPITLPELLMFANSTFTNEVVPTLIVFTDLPNTLDTLANAFSPPDPPLSNIIESKGL